MKNIPIGSINRRRIFSVAIAKENFQHLHNHKRADGCHQRIFRKDVIDRATQLIHKDNVIDFVAECAARIQTQESTMLPVLEAKLREVKKESASRFDLEAGSALYASDSLRNNIIFNCTTLTILGYCLFCQNVNVRAV